MCKRLAAAFAILILSFTSAAAQTARKDRDILDDVTRQVNQYSRFTVFDDISVAVDQGVVTLAGKVTMPYKKNDLEHRTRAVAGVRSVQNQIEVLPVSIFDDELRYRIARAIYGNPAFWNYAAMVNPPIHIVVDKGHVTLTGVVNNEVERTLAKAIASSFDAFSVKNELKTDPEALAARLTYGS